MLALAILSITLFGAAQSASADVVDDRVAAVGGSLAWRGSDGQLKTTAWLGEQWAQPTTHAGQITSGPSMSVRPSAVDFFARGTDNQIYHKFLNRSTGAWSDWGPLGGCAASAPASSYRSTGQIDVFIRGCDSTLMHKYWDPSTGWSGWGSLGGYVTYAPSAVSNNGTIDVFVTGGDGGLYAKTWTGSYWTDFARFASNVTSAPSAVNERAGSVSVFARDTAGNAGMTQWTGSAWSPWGSFGNAGNGVPTANAEPGLVTVWTHSGDQLYFNRFTAGATSWTGWGPLYLNSPWGGGNRVVDTAAEADIVIAKRRAQSDSTAFTVWDGLTPTEQNTVTTRANATIPTSVAYGGRNWKLDSLGEATPVQQRLVSASESEQTTLLSGLSPTDRTYLKSTMVLQFGAPTVTLGPEETPTAEDTAELGDADDAVPSAAGYAARGCRVATFKRALKSAVVTYAYATHRIRFCWNKRKQKTGMDRKVNTIDIRPASVTGSGLTTELRDKNEYYWPDAGIRRHVFYERQLHWEVSYPIIGYVTGGDVRRVARGVWDGTASDLTSD